MALPAEGQPAVFFEGGSRGIPSLRKTVYEGDLVAAGDNARECEKYLKARNLIPCRVGIIGVRELMPYPQLKFLMESLAGSDVVEAGRIVREMRRVKSDREQDEIRRAARIVGDIFAAIPSFDFPGLTERAIEACVIREARFERAEEARVLFGRSRAEGWHLAYPEERPIAEGETIALFLAIEFERYWAEAARSFTVDKGFLMPSEGGLEELYRRAVSWVKPGTRASDVYAQVLQGARELGIDLVLDYGLGQGIGLAPARSAGDRRGRRHGASARHGSRPAARGKGPDRGRPHDGQIPSSSRTGPPGF